MKPFALRVLDDNDFKEVEKLSKSEVRSVNGQFNVLLKEALEARKNLSK